MDSFEFKVYMHEDDCQYYIKKIGFNQGS